jgi:hypothetical protein
MNVQTTMNKSVTRINSLASSRQHGKERTNIILITWIKLPIVQATYHKMDSVHSCTTYKKKKKQKKKKKKETDDFALKPFSWLQQSPTLSNYRSDNLQSIKHIKRKN